MARARAIGRGRGFTLIELLVALALAMMISAAVTFIASQAQKIYSDTTAKVALYNNVRYALDMMETELPNIIPTADLEFFMDTSERTGTAWKHNGHWDEGEEIRDREQINLGGGFGGGGFLKRRAVSGASFQPEYDEAAYVLERRYTNTDRAQGEEDAPHDAFEIYFRAPTYIDGAVRVANIEYKLADPDRINPTNGYCEPIVHTDGNKNLVLVRVLRYADHGDVMNRGRKWEVNCRVTELCWNVTDFKIEYYTVNPFSDRVPFGFRTPQEDFRRPTEPCWTIGTSHVGALQPDQGVWVKPFIYGSSLLSAPYDKGVADLGNRVEITQLKPVLFRTDGKNTQFVELSPGDRIWIFRSQGAQTKFPTGEHTILTNHGGFLEFREEVDSTGWGSAQTQLQYKAAWVPRAFRVTLRLTNEKGQEPRVFQRVFQVLGRRS